MAPRAATRFTGTSLSSHWTSHQCAQVGDDELELRIVWSEEPGHEVIDGIVGSMHGVADPNTVIRLKSVERLEVMAKTCVGCR